MIKKLFALVAVFLLLTACVLPIYAANGKVTYGKNAKEFIFEPGSEKSPTDLFPNFKGVMPGDTLTQKITVKNEASKEVKVDIYIRSLGSDALSADFLSKLNLKVRKSEENNMAYMFDAAANEKSTLEDWVLLGTLYSGGEVNLDVILSVPTSLGNDYQDKVGFIDWEFKVEEMPAEPDDPKPPQTGDNTRIDLLITVAIIALVLFIVIISRRKAQREED